MHTSSFIKAKIFVDEYAPELPAQSGQIRVLEVGSKSYHDQDTYRGLFPAPRFSYTGLDIESGDNVDVVPRNPFIWDEIPDCSFECCVSAQTFEHNPFFWITFAEIARVLVPGGISFIAAPGGGPVHRYPIDCWRFYPDSWAALCVATGMELVESYFETDAIAATLKGQLWRDSIAIVRKPALPGDELNSFHERLRKLVLLFKEEIMEVRQAPLTPGKWRQAYESEMRRSYPMTLSKQFKRIVRGRAVRIHK